MKIRSSFFLGLVTGIGFAVTLAAYAASTQLGTIANYKTTVNTVSFTACTLSATTGCSGSGDCGRTLSMIGTNPVITIPATLATGCAVNVLQTGTTQVSITGSAVTAATLLTPNSFVGKTAGQNAMIGVLILSNSGGSSAVAVMTGNGA
jgi:hypothetical protein